MHAHRPFAPDAVFASGPTYGLTPPQVLAAPSRYIQGDGVLTQLGRYLALVPSRCTAVLISAGGQQRDGTRIARGLDAAGIANVFVTFGGECSFFEIEQAVAAVRNSGLAVDSLIAVGGGKCIDAGKCVAYRLNVPIISCPSLASNDAPCSAVSVIYTPEGVTEALEFFPQNPALVVVDTRIVADAPLRYLISGMGDAMATWYEARTCLDNPSARNVLAARPTLAAAALGELCAKTLYTEGVAAAEAVRRCEVTPALNHVVEANTLLSGLGFESGGLAAAHAVAQGLTVLSRVHTNFLHGEMVAMGLMTQLVLEQRLDEATQVAEFLCAVGLPAHLGHLTLDATQAADLEAVMNGATLMPFLANEPFAVTPDALVAATIEADRLGKEVVRKVGDAAYRSIHVNVA
ncbi:MAG: glycerol dehydrogenase [Alphaproteobacteria bacterium]